MATYRDKPALSSMAAWRLFGTKLLSMMAQPIRVNAMFHACLQLRATKVIQDYSGPPLQTCINFNISMAH